MKHFLEHLKWALGFSSYLIGIALAVIFVLAVAHAIAVYNVRNNVPTYTLKECK